MELILTRIAKRKTYTIGRLSILKEENEEYRTYKREDFFCDTLEPPVLEMKTSLPKEDVLRSPKKAEALKPFVIPEGRYPVVITWSPKFKMWLPLLLGVPMDTQGCILVGRNQIVGRVLESRKWLYELKQKIIEAKARGDAVWLTIK